MPHIFISYAKIDTRDLAMRLHAALNAVEGLSAWMDATLQTGESWATQIQDEIDRADLVLVLLSPDVNRKPTEERGRSFVLNEIDYAQQDRKPILPMMAQKTRVPVQIAGLQYVDVTGEADGGVVKVINMMIDKFELKGKQDHNDDVTLDKVIFHYTWHINETLAASDSIEITTLHFDDE